MTTIQQLEPRFLEPTGWQWGWMTNARGQSLRYGFVNPSTPPKAHILFVEGKSNFCELSFEMAHDFVKEGLGFYVIDRMGQGKSPRYLKDIFKLHSQGLGHDIDDLAQFTKQVIPNTAPVILLGHSAGGLLATLAIKNQDQNAKLWHGLSITAPMFGIKDPLLKNRESAFARMPMHPTFSELYIPGGSGWTPRSNPNRKNGADDYTSDPVRQMLSDVWETNKPSVQTGSMTFGFVKHLCKGIAETRQHGFLASIKEPKAAFTAENEIFANVPALNQAIAQMQNVVVRGHYMHGKHDLPWETDDIRDDVIGGTLALVPKL